MNESHCRLRVVGEHEAHEHESIIGQRFCTLTQNCRMAEGHDGGCKP